MFLCKRGRRPSPQPTSDSDIQDSALVEGISIHPSIHPSTMALHRCTRRVLQKVQCFRSLATVTETESTNPSSTYAIESGSLSVARFTAERLSGGAACRSPRHLGRASRSQIQRQTPEERSTARSDGWIQIRCGTYRWVVCSWARLLLCSMASLRIKDACGRKSCPLTPHTFVALSSIFQSLMPTRRSLD